VHLGIFLQLKKISASEIGTSVLQGFHVILAMMKYANTQRITVKCREVICCRIFHLKKTKQVEGLLLYVVTDRVTY